MIKSFLSNDLTNVRTICYDLITNQKEKQMFVKLNIEIHGKGAVQISIPKELVQETIATLVQIEDVTWIGIEK